MKRSRSSMLGLNMPCIFWIQLSQAGDLIIEVYLEEKTPDCCITLKVSTDLFTTQLCHMLEGLKMFVNLLCR